MNKVHLIDNMEFMKNVPDKYYELAIVDPPYSESCNLKGGLSRHGTHGWKTFSDKIDEWNKRPEKGYFQELFRVSKNQIVWGGNYFELPISQGWVFWDKGQRNFSLADGELAWTSYNRALRVFSFSRSASTFTDIKTHPTQKPVALYKWLLKNYAKPNDKIFDSHVGSGSIRIACHDMGFDFEGCEIDKDYWEAQEKRYQEHISQADLFTAGIIQESIYQANLL